MGKGHFESKAEPFDWEGFQTFMGYSDDELAAIQNDPRRAEHVKIMCSPAVQDKYLVCEVVESHGCVAGLEVGDRIVYKGLGTLDTEHTTTWCPHMITPHWFLNNMKTFIKGGIDPEASYVAYGRCMDVGSEYGFGRGVYKAYAVDKSKIDSI